VWGEIKRGAEDESKDFFQKELVESDTCYEKRKDTAIL